MKPLSIYRFLVFLAACTMGVPSFGADVSSASYKLWTKGLWNYLTNPNEFVAERAFADFSESAATLSPSEQAAALRVLRAASRQGQLRKAAGFPDLFSPDFTQRRTRLFAELEKQTWTGGVKALLEDLLDDMAARPGDYNPEVFWHDALAETCRERKIGADRLAKVLESRLSGEDAEFTPALYLAHRARPGDSEIWGRKFDVQFNQVVDAGRLGNAFGLFEAEAWDKLEKTRATYGQRLADRLYDHVEPAAWTKIHPGRFCSMVKASSHPGVEWEYRLLECVVGPDGPACKTLLNQLTRSLADPKASFARHRTFLEKNQEVFCGLHEEPAAVMDYWNSVPANRIRAQAILVGFLDVAREKEWIGALATLLRKYYETGSAEERKELYEKAYRPIIHARLDPSFDPARAANPLRRTLTGQLLAQPCFLEPGHHRDAVLPYMQKLDWGADVQVEDATLPVYRFTARGLIALRSSRVQSEADAKEQVDDLAGWVDWMAAGMIGHPDRFNMGVDAVAETLREICAAWRQLKTEYGLQSNSEALKNLFSNLAKELRSAAEAARVSGAGSTAGAASTRLVRAIRLALVISALLEEEELLPLIQDTLRELVFPVPVLPAGSTHVLAPVELQRRVDLFCVLDVEISDTVSELFKSQDASPGAKGILQSFARNHHMELQLPLLRTDRFLAALLEKDARLDCFRRYLAKDASMPPFRLDDAGRGESKDKLVDLLAHSGFINSESGLSLLLDLYRESETHSLWKEPGLFGLNENINLPVLLRMLRAEGPPRLNPQSREGDGVPGKWPNGIYLPVLDIMLAQVSADAKANPIREVAYDASGKATRVERYAPIRFVHGADLLLRAQELLSFPITVAGEAVSSSELVEALVEGALSDPPECSLPGLVLPGEGLASRQIDGERRSGLCAALAATPPESLREAVAVAQCALMLPNSPANATDSAKLAQYDQHREASYQLLSAKLTAETARDDMAADALITMLRLDGCRRDRGPSGEARSLVARLSQSLPPVGRWRVMLELWSLTRRSGNDLVKVEPCDEKDANLNPTRKCRDQVATQMMARVSELEDIRKFCLDQAGVTVSAAPTNEWQVIAQLSRALRRMDGAAAEIDGIGPDAVKASWYLVSQIKRATRCIPREWPETWVDAVETDEPMATALIKLSVFSVAAYSDIMPIYADITLSDLLGGDTRQANGDALAVFGVLDTETKRFLLSVSPLIEKVEKETAITLQPIDSPGIRELVAVHSALQPHLVSGIWERGAGPVRGGQSLLQFVMEGRQYKESRFDVDLVLEVGGSFTLSPRLIFDQAFQAIDLLVECAGTAPGDRFVYDAWFGDLRATLAKNGLRSRENFNMDRFLCQASGIPEDPRYDPPEFDSVRPFADAFRRDLSKWLQEGASATLGGLLRRARTPRVFAAMANRIGDRLGLIPEPSAPETLPALSGERLAGYAGFCRRALFDTSGGRPVFPKEVGDAQRTLFSSSLASTNDLPVARANFLNLFDHELASEEEPSRRLGHFASFYRRASVPSTEASASKFAADFSHAYLHLAAEIYWSGAKDSPDQTAKSKAVSLSFPWRIDVHGKPYIDATLPDLHDPNQPLHTREIRAQVEWRAAAAARFQAIPFLCRFFGGDPRAGKVPSGSKP